MTGRERVIRALEFDDPDRTPRDLWWLPAVEMFQEEDLNHVLKRFPMDISYPEFEPGQSDFQRKSDFPNCTVYGLINPTEGRYIDEWGSIWHVSEDGVLGEVKEPSLKDLSNVEDLKVPWGFLDSTSFQDVDEICNQTDRFTLSGISARPFERMQFIRGTENLYKDIIQEKDKVVKLRDKIHEYNKAHLRKWLETDVDGIWMMDDWGANNNLLISPDIWRELLKPLYKEYCEMIHEADKYVFFHSDGWIEDVYGDVIEVGIDALNSQLFTMDIEELGSKYKGEITFWGEIDRQYLLPFGEPEEIKQAVSNLKSTLEDDSGGVIAQCEWGKENPRENVEAVFEAWDNDF